MTAVLFEHLLGPYLSISSHSLSGQLLFRNNMVIISEDAYSSLSSWQITRTKPTSMLEDFNYDDAFSIHDDEKAHEVEDEINTKPQAYVAHQVQEDDEFNPVLNPYVGKEFNTDDEAYSFYNAFARREGFGIRKDKCRYTTDGVVYRRQYVCYKEGKYSKGDEMGDINAKRRRTVSRDNCMARMKIKKTDEGKWLVTDFNNDHNHEQVTPSKIDRIRSHMKMTTEAKRMVDTMQAIGMRPCTITSILKEQTQRSMGIDSHNVRNYMYEKEKRYIGKDAQSVLDYFRSMQEKDTSFVWAIQVDEEQRLQNIFWADGNSRKHCQYYGDVIVFDTTYKTNKYELPFAPFTGVNNHRQSRLLGCALLSDETEDSFIWLFKTWLAAMYGRHPVAILTDQDRAITAAVREVFPNSHHCYCMWHILKKFPEKFSACTSYQEFHRDFQRCIYNSQTCNVFESRWKSLLEKHNLTENEWLGSLYMDRRMWVPIYVREHFMAGMSTTQRSEGMNSYFDNFITPTTPLHAFVRQYERALKDRRDKEKEEDYKTHHETPKKHTVMLMEKQAANVYTRVMFYIFQEELDQSLGCIEELIDTNGEICSYLLKQINNVEEDEGEDEKSASIIRRSCEYTVTFNMTEKLAHCSCKMLQFQGMPCRHILTIFRVNHVFTIPDFYILKRWTRNAMIGEVSSFQGVDVQEDPNTSMIMRYNCICWEANAFAQKAASCKETFEFGMRALRELGVKVDTIIKDKESTSHENESNDERVRLLVQSKQSDAILNQVTLKDPRQANVKGRNPNSRMKSSLEKKTTKNLRKCRSCKEITDHDSRTCPLKPNKLRDQNLQRTNEEDAG